MNEEETALPEQQKIILVIEDDRDMNELMCAILERSGYEALSAFDWKAAFELLKTTRPDLILLDFMLPDANGSEICRSIGKDEKLKEIPVIMISSLRDLPIKMSSLLAGAIRFINKPFSYEEIISEVEHALKKKKKPTSFWDEVSKFTQENL
ncbi:MAG: response regulator [bacterium]